MNPFQSLRNYEDFIYQLVENYPSIVYSTLVTVQRSARQATIAGEVVFGDAYRLVLQERLDFADTAVTIRYYGYELWHGKEKRY